LQRKIDQEVYNKAIEEKISPILARIIAGRITTKDLVDDDIIKIIHPTLKDLYAPTMLMNAELSANRIVLAIEQKERIGILTDYDVDGITAHAIIRESFTKYFKYPVDLLTAIIGQRLKDGYGISDSLVNKIISLPKAVRPTLIITADCGSSDEKRLSRFKDHGIDVVVTDHHIVPADNLPLSAYALVNPTQPGCLYPDKLIAGCAVAWLLMCEVNKRLNTNKKLTPLLDYVALGTVADAVSLFSPTNRAVVTHGLAIMNKFARPCWEVFQTSNSNRNGKPITVSDLGFQIGPRINARSRMDDPYAALLYLQADDHDKAMTYYSKLDKNNEERKVVESQMVGEARKASFAQKDNLAVVVYNPEFHAGVQGIVASRLVDMTGKPAVMLSPIKDDLEIVTGSCRTIPSVNIRQCLQFVADNTEDVLQSFGGHIGAAGCKVKLSKIDTFREFMDLAIKEQLGENPDMTQRSITDGEVFDNELNLATCESLKYLEPYGRGFEEPVFEGDFKVTNLKMIGNPAIHMRLEFNNKHKAIWFRAIQKPDAPVPIEIGDTISCTYSMSVNEFNNNKNLQLIIKKLAKSKNLT